MGYELHIEQPDGILAFDDWEAAARETPGVRLAPPGSQMKVEDPETGELLAWELPEGTVEMQFGGEWIPVFYWHGGYVTFKLGDEPEPVLAAALQLAAKLQATVRGDEGEQYTSIEDVM